MNEIIKRDGRKVPFDKSKIVTAILKAFNEVDGHVDTYAITKANNIANYIEAVAMTKELSIEEIQDYVENGLMQTKRRDVAKAYILYRDERTRKRGNSTDQTIEEILLGKNEYWSKENSNKNEKVVTTQRDYMAGVVSTDLTMRKLLPKDIVDAHNEGIIHFHDADYFAQNALNNCCLINLEDMLQNGTVINGVMIEKQTKFITASTVATQIILGVSSSQYGGCTITLTHLAPFVRGSFLKYLKDANKYFNDDNKDDDVLNSIIDGTLWNGYEYIEERYPNLYKYSMDQTKREIKDGVQTFNYQVNSMTNTNGQAPFLSVNMYLGETEEYKDELAMVIEEFLNQRILGFKNTSGVYITPAFPKLLYVLEEDNIHEDSKYYYLTKLAAKCTAKRMVPDYISEKIMKRDKIDSNGNGQCYPCMGCVTGDDVITYKYHGILYIESFERMWNRVAIGSNVKSQGKTKNLYIDTNNLLIYDTKLHDFTVVKRLIRNISNKWVRVTIQNGRFIECTEDHPFHTFTRGRVLAKDLIAEYDTVMINKSQYTEENYETDSDISYALGVILCDGDYSHDESSMKVELFIGCAEDAVYKRTKEGIKKYFNNQDIHGLFYGKKHGKLCGEHFSITPNSRYKFISLFGGIQKKNRHIPNIIFNSCRKSRVSFLAGMIDATGYISNNLTKSTIHIDSRSKELAIQTMELMQSIDIESQIYITRASCKDKVRYRVEGTATKELINEMKCLAKTNNFVKNTAMSIDINEATITGIEYIDKCDFSYDVTTESDHFEVSGIYSHNCRSFLTPYVDENNKPKYYGRLNCGVVTISLPDIALSSGKDMDKFWKLFDERTELCHKALRIRFDRVAEAYSDVAPILWQYGAFARLAPGTKLRELLSNGYATVSLGYAGLYECVKYMTGESHSSGKGKEFGLEVMQALNDKCTQWKNEEHIAYSLYGSPIESTTYKFAKNLKRRFGIIEGITDRDYITNSYHINVREHISWKDKLSIESEFQKLSPGGAISYIESPDMNGNPEALIEILKFMYNTIMYSEINSKSDYCQNCGYDGEIKIEGTEGKFYWRCPKCGCTDERLLNVARRTCGYIGSQFWNQGRTEEIKERVVHIGGNDAVYEV